MKIAVTGAFSYSGKYIARRLLERGEEVITLTGHPNRPDPFGGKVKAYPLDFDQDSISRSEGTTTIVNKLPPNPTKKPVDKDPKKPAKPEMTTPDKPKQPQRRDSTKR